MHENLNNFVCFFIGLFWNVSSCCQQTARLFSFLLHCFKMFSCNNISVLPNLFLYFQFFFTSILLVISIFCVTFQDEARSEGNSSLIAVQRTQQRPPSVSKCIMSFTPAKTQQAIFITNDRSGGFAMPEIKEGRATRHLLLG